MQILDISRRLRLAMAGTTLLTLGACGTLDGVSSTVTQVVSPYRPEIVQGNFVSREQVALLKPGMNKLQLRQLLGTPLVTSIFHSDRWDYVFTLNRQGLPPQQRRLTLFFKGDALERFEGDPMPSEQEFVATISKPGPAPQARRLQATDEELQQFQAANPVAARPQTPLSAGPAKTYPPLEQEPAR